MILFLVGFLIGAWFGYLISASKAPRSAPLKPCVWCGHPKGDHVDGEDRCAGLVLGEIHHWGRGGAELEHCPCPSWVESLEWVE